MNHTPFLHEVVAKFTQDSDDDQENPGGQELTVKAIDCGAGPYLVIETERWAIDHPEELNGLLARVMTGVFPLFAGGTAEAE